MIASIWGLKFWEGSGVEGTGIWIGAVVFARVFAFSEGTQKWRHRSAGGGRRGPWFAYFSGFLASPFLRSTYSYFIFNSLFLSQQFLFPLGRVLFEQPDSSASTNNLTPVANTVMYRVREKNKHSIIQ